MINIAARIRDRGEYVRPGVKKGIGVYKVRCQGCGEYIFFRQRPEGCGVREDQAGNRTVLPQGVCERDLEKKNKEK